MPLNDVEICSAALVKIGASAITAFDDESVEADVARRLYEITVQGLISAHPWHFSIAQVALEPVLGEQLGGFAHAFALPADALRTISTGADSRAKGLPYRVAGTRLFANSPSVTLSYQRRPEASEFPPFFNQALIARLAAELCLPLTESTNRAEALYKLAAAELRVAKLVDSQQATPRAVEDFTLIAARGQ